MENKIILAAVSISILIMTYYDAPQNFMTMISITLFINGVYWIVKKED